MNHRPMFRTHHEFTVLKHIRLTAKSALAVGDTIAPAMFPKYRLMRWYAARMIAQKGSAFALEYLASKKRIAGAKAEKEKYGLLKADSQTVGEGNANVEAITSHYAPITPEVNTAANPDESLKTSPQFDKAKAKSKQVK
jgi:hypothetical protein